MQGTLDGGEKLEEIKEHFLSGIISQKQCD